MTLLSAEERKLAVERLPEVVIKRGQLGLSIFRRVLLSWEFWALSILALLAGDSELYADNSILNLFLDYLGTYSVEQVNYIPSAIYGIGIVSIFLCSWYADYFEKSGGRWHTGLLLSFTAIISGSIMLKPPSLGAKMFALFLNGVQLGYRGVLFAWANQIMRRDDAKRAIVIGMMNAMSEFRSLLCASIFLLIPLCVAIAFYIWWSLVFFNAAQVPDWYMGSISMICTGVAMMASLFSVVWFERRDEIRRAAADGMPPQEDMPRQSDEVTWQKEPMKTTMEV